MYDELIKRLRDAAKMSEALAVLLPHSEGNATAKLYNEAADAIEELVTLKALADAKIKKLESAKAKKKRPPKRLPCTCGRKQLDLWWSDNPGNKGWFLKCPNCGRESQPERYKINAVSAWNNGLQEPPKEK